MFKIFFPDIFASCESDNTTGYKTYPEPVWADKNDTTGYNNLVTRSHWFFPKFVCFFVVLFLQCTFWLQIYHQTCINYQYLNNNPRKPKTLHDPKRPSHCPWEIPRDYKGCLPIQQKAKSNFKPLLSNIQKLDKVTYEVMTYLLNPGKF